MCAQVSQPQSELKLFTHSITQALVSADKGAEKGRKDISRFTRRIAFFGTPLQRFEEVKWEAMNAKAEFREILNATRKRLSGLEQEFLNLMRRRADKPDENIKLVCFYEGKDPKVCTAISMLL